MMNMSDNVKVPYGDSASDTATLLLAAAEEKGLGPQVVGVDSSGYFTAPEEVVKAAGLESVDPDKEFNDEIEKARAEAEKTSVDAGLPPRTNPAVEPIAPSGDNGPDAAEGEPGGSPVVEPEPYSSSKTEDDEQPKPAKKTAAKKTAPKKD